MLSFKFSLKSGQCQQRFKNWPPNQYWTVVLPCVPLFILKWVCATIYKSSFTLIHALSNFSNFRILFQLNLVEANPLILYTMDNSLSLSLNWFLIETRWSIMLNEYIVLYPLFNITMAYKQCKRNTIVNYTKIMSVAKMWGNKWDKCTAPSSTFLAYVYIT